MFCLAIQPILERLGSELIIGYLDDVTLGGNVKTVRDDFELMKLEGEQLGLKLNISKCEVLTRNNCNLDIANTFPGFQMIDIRDAQLLGSPILSDRGLDVALDDKCNKLQNMLSRLKHLSAHHSLVIIRHCISVPMVMHILLSGLNSELVLGYLDDVTVGGEAGRVAQDIVKFRDETAVLGLELNISKCEVITYEGTHLPFPLDHFAAQGPEEAILLGAPLVEGPVMDLLLSSRVADLSRAIDRLHLLSSHDALLILRHSLAAPKLMHTLRSSPCAGNAQLDLFDTKLRAALCLITNTRLDDLSWLQASLPVQNGGLGVRSVGLLAPSAFLASAAATHELQARIAPRVAGMHDPSMERVVIVWQDRHDRDLPLELDMTKTSLLGSILHQQWTRDSEQRIHGRL